MMVQIVTAGRKDVDEFFKLSDVFTAERLNHTPLIVFIATEDAVQVRLLDHARDLLSLPDETPLMGQWRGTIRSDFWQGGVKRIDFEYIDERRIRVLKSVIAKAEIERLIQFFYAEGIPVAVESSR